MMGVSGREGFGNLVRITSPGCEEEFQTLLAVIDDIGRLA